MNATNSKPQDSGTGQPRRVVIVGAGPAGMALAYLLARRGFGVTVLESHHDFARVFRGEGFQQSGIEVFRQMGLGERFDQIPHIELQTFEIYHRGKLLVRTDSAGLGRDRARLVSQPPLLQMLADEASRHPGFRLEYGVRVRGLLRENGRVIGVRASTAAGPREYYADLVVGADGRHAATRKHSGLPEIFAPQDYDVLWLKVPYPEGYPPRTVQSEIAPQRVVIAFPTADGQLQIGYFIPKGGMAALRARGVEDWTEDLVRRLPGLLPNHVRAHRDAVAHATVLDVVCGRLTQWSAPGLLLIGDAAHPMSPVGGQGVNIALRDAVVAANHLCPVLSDGADWSAIDAAAQRVQHERWPEIVAVQQMQQEHARLLATPDCWTAQLTRWLLPCLLQTGLLQWLKRKEYREMSHGVLPVRLAV